MFSSCNELWRFVLSGALSAVKLWVASSNPIWGPNPFFELSLSSNSHASPSDHDHAASHDTFPALQLPGGPSLFTIAPTYPAAQNSSPVPGIHNPGVQRIEIETASAADTVNKEARRPIHAILHAAPKMLI